MNRRGYTLVELIVSMSILTIFLGILFQLTLEMWNWQKRLPIDFHKHPQIIAVVSRMRQDVLDAQGTDPYYETYEEFTDSPKTLILETLTPTGTQTIVWDFSTPGRALRRAYQVGNYRDWRANGVPVDFMITPQAGGAGRADGIRLRATDKEGRLAIDQIFLPRTHE